MDLAYIFSIVLLALGFGFVIFWHELGHFLAAKWAGVKVEQFAVGFGTAICSWRKGLGWRTGSSRREYEKRAREYLRAQEGSRESVDATTDDQRLDYAAAALGLGETEYRLNWLPLGGYVKMLGQDDLNPNAQVNDPRAYNMQPIPKRMVIVSAGVIMNIILAAVGFFVLFLIGFKVPPAIVGAVAPMSPAQAAGMQVGDHILTMDGKPQLDWTKVPLNVALLPDDRDVQIEVERPSDGLRHTLTIRASRGDRESRGMLALGVLPTPELRGIDPSKLSKEEQFDPKMDSPADKQVAPGDEIIAVEGEPVDPKRDYWKLDHAVQRSGGKPVEVTVRHLDGTISKERIHSSFLPAFGEQEVDFLGLMTRSAVERIVMPTLVKDKLFPGDVIVAIRSVGANDRSDNPTRTKVIEIVNKAGDEGDKVEFTVLRDGKIVPVEPVIPTLKNDAKRYGVGFQVGNEENSTVIGGIVQESAAARAGVPRGATIVSINDRPVESWYDVFAVLRGAAPEKPIKLVAKTPEGGAVATYELKPSAGEMKKIAAYLLQPELRLRERIDERKTTNPLVAAQWGVGETRDLIVQFYLTLKRIVQRTVPASNLMGPLGIATVGAKFAYKGNDWLIWFLSMISANLAVVNFLPIPIVDGGLFLFLIIEKLQGRPLSARTQSIARVVGLALILSVFIFVTYQDIMR